MIPATSHLSYLFFDHQLGSFIQLVGLVLKHPHPGFHVDHGLMFCRLNSLKISDLCLDTIQGVGQSFVGFGLFKLLRNLGQWGCLGISST